jgi:hypothetical protein
MLENIQNNGKRISIENVLFFILIVIDNADFLF